MALPLKANEVDPKAPFTPEELLYRRVERSELNSRGEVDPTRINAVSFRKDVESAPSVMRSKFSSPQDVLDVLCAERDVNGWLVFSIRVDELPTGLTTGDGRSFDFFPKHVPLENCGAHSVTASALSGDPSRTYAKPNPKVTAAFKARFATALKQVPLTGKENGAPAED